MKKYIWIIALITCSMFCACYESGDIDDIEVLKTLKSTQGGQSGSEDPQKTDSTQQDDSQRIPSSEDNIPPA